MDETATPFVDDVDRFLAQHEMSAVTFGRLSLRDPHFVRDLRAGRRLWPSTEAKVREFMSSYLPSETAVGESVA